MFSPPRRPSVTPRADESADPDFQRSAPRGMPRLAPLERLGRAAAGASEPSRFVAGERLSLLSEDPPAAAGRSLRFLTRAALVVLVILAAIGAASLARPYL